MDIIFLRGLKIECLIGVWEWERRTTQTIRLDLEMATDIRAAARSDELDDTLSYKAVAKRLQQFVGDSSYKLVETLAEQVAELVLKEFEISWVKLTLHKGGAVRGAEDVGIIIERGLKQ